MDTMIPLGCIAGFALLLIGVVGSSLFEILDRDDDERWYYFWFNLIAMLFVALGSALLAKY